MPNNYVQLALESALSVFGMRSIYEQPKYEALATVEMVQIRRYAPRVAAEVTVIADSEERARDEAFRVLAGYIFGGIVTKRISR